jgi:hypothetical protein
MECEMGGFGSGNYSRKGGRRKCEDSFPLDIRDLYRAGCLVPGRRFSWVWTRRGKKYASIGAWVEEDHMTLEYMHGEEKVRQRIPFNWTTPEYGGKRIWFACPYCGERCAVLYAMGQYYGCRKCAGVVHRSNAQDDIKRKVRKAAKLRLKIGALPAPAYDLPTYKPINMHHRTWEQIKTDIYVLEAPFWERSSRRSDGTEIKLAAIAKRMKKRITKGGKLKYI